MNGLIVVFLYDDQAAEVKDESSKIALIVFLRWILETLAWIGKDSFNNLSIRSRINQSPQPYCSPTDQTRKVASLGHGTVCTALGNNGHAMCP